MRNKISGVYKITNNITSDFYIGSSINIERRWKQHKASSVWKGHSNSKLYKDMAQFGLDNFLFEVLEETDNLKEREQYYIGQLKPTYNDRRANGRDIERYRKHNNQTSKEYYSTEKGKETQKRYRQSEKGKETHRRFNNKYLNKLCLYKGEILTLNALYKRFIRRDVSRPMIEAKKYLLEGIK